MPRPLSAILLKSILALALIAMGAGGTFWLWKSWRHAEETRAWVPVEAVVISSQMLSGRATPHSPVKFTADVRYRYTFNGKTFTGHRIRRVDGPTAHRQKTEAVVAAHPVGSVVTCHVNPVQPDFAILEHSSRAALYSIWFPLLFVAGGVGMIVSAWRTNS